MRSPSLLWSFDYAIQGIVYALRTQRNMRIHAALAFGVLVAALLLRVSGLELVALLFAIALVFAAELVNTAVEAAVDLATEGFDPIAKTAKDVAAGAVLVATINAIAVGYVVLFARLARSAQTVVTAGHRSPASLTLIGLALTGIVVLAVKALNKEGTFARGGWPSGHTAVAAGLAAAIGWASNSAKVFLLALGIAALVAQSRVENGAHTVAQVVVGGMIGFLLVTAVFQVFLW